MRRLLTFKYTNDYVSIQPRSLQHINFRTKPCVSHCFIFLSHRSSSSVTVLLSTKMLNHFILLQRDIVAAQPPRTVLGPNVTRAASAAVVYARILCLGLHVHDPMNCWGKKLPRGSNFDNSHLLLRGTSHKGGKALAFATLSRGLFM
ncbi:hypothetical protein SCLCIDRAFT_310413 [Scleroderma citrinum Foug A]|uniref:Uncharacterized protein n=1 Tax=Scleroderma citrinum Foug A TaxID=1036808 RepID=A0A0C3D3A7_9AGAM|nr:hypothetical protein SCLCIDRAFT_310413 [Scleroderma citrinum Foug A]